jgi:internalin A
MRMRHLVTLVPIAAIAAGVMINEAWVTSRGGTLKTGTTRQIVELKLRSSWISDSDLQTVATARELQRLDLSHTRITDLGFQHLKMLQNVTELNLYYAEQVGDGALAVARNWRKLRRLNLSGTKVTDAGIAQLVDHPSLEAIDVGFSLFTDGGFESLTAIPNLTELAVGGNKVTDVGLNSLRLMPKLTILDLGGAQRTDSGLWAASVTDRGLEAISSLVNLRELNLRGAKISDAGADKIAALGMLRVLDLSETQLSAAGLGVITKLPAIERLAFYKGAKIDDRVIALLGNMPSLLWVDLTGTKVTAEAVARLREARPKLRVVWTAAS